MGFNVFVDIRLYENIYYYNGKFYLPKNEVGNEKKDKEYLDNFVYDSINLEDKECIDLCNNVENCMLFTYNKNNNKCYLKHRVNTLSDYPNAVTYIKSYT